MNRLDLKSARELFADYLDEIGMSEEDKAALLKNSFHDPIPDEMTAEEADRINRYVDSCPRPLANGGYKNTLTGDYIDPNEDDFVGLVNGTTVKVKR